MMQKLLSLTFVFGWIVLSGPSATQAESLLFTPSAQVVHMDHDFQVAPQTSGLGDRSAPSLDSFNLNIISTVDVDLNINLENEIKLVLRPDGVALENLSVALESLSEVSLQAEASTLTTVTLTLAGLTPGNTGISLSSPSGALANASGNPLSINSRPSGGVTVTPEPGAFFLLGTFLTLGRLFAWRFRRRDV